MPSLTSIMNTYTYIKSPCFKYQNVLKTESCWFLSEIHIKIFNGSLQREATVGNYFHLSMLKYSKLKFMYGILNQVIYLTSPIISSLSTSLYLYKPHTHLFIQK